MAGRGTVSRLFVMIPDCRATVACLTPGCCGTGPLAVHFLQNGFRVVGVDRSPHMLKAARVNCQTYGASGRADYVQADVTDFATDSRFGLVASTFDAPNHVEDTTALERVFRSVRRALRPDGLFFFDLNTRKALLHWNHMQVTEDEQVTVINRGIYAPQMDRAYARISGFIRDDDGRCSRFEKVFYSTPFRLSEVRGRFWKRQAWMTCASCLSATSWQ